MNVFPTNFNMYLPAVEREKVKADSGKNAVKRYRRKRGRIDIVIIDMIMPDMSSGKTYDRLKVTNQEVKVLLPSGCSIDGETSEITERGCDGCVQKPFRLKKKSRKIM